MVAGGWVKIVIMSVAACYKKSTSLTSGNFIFFGKKVTVSSSRSEQGFSKKHLIHL